MPGPKREFMHNSTIFSVDQESTKTKARTGKLHLFHGDIETPVFMPVGTNGIVKAVKPDILKDIGYSLILSNTYHLYLRPGKDIIQHFGGLHEFSRWQGNILTDSGGYQVFSLAPFRKIFPEGVQFRSHVDGSYHFLSPEDVTDIQCAFGSDIQMPLDVCTPPGISHEESIRAVQLTTDWARRSKRAWLDRINSGYKGILFGIVQGNFFHDLRKKSAENIEEIDFPGNAIGGLSVGESFDVFKEVLSLTSNFLSDTKPKYVMGIGTPEYVFEAVEQGIDMFDCVYPTRIARNGSVLTYQGVTNLKKEYHKLNEGPIDEKCSCAVCKTYSRAFLRHLFKTKEIIGPVLATEHNLHFMYTLLESIKASIRMDKFEAYKKDFLHVYNQQRNVK